MATYLTFEKSDKAREALQFFEKAEQLGIQKDGIFYYYKG